MRVAQVGYGEVGGIFAAALAKSGACEVAAFDVLVAEPGWEARARKRAASDGVTLALRLEDAVSGADLAISAVTAAATTGAAEGIGRTCRPGTFVLDVNSASPGTKSACADAVNGAGGRYVEAAVMNSVGPYGLRVPMLLGGPHAAALQPELARLGFAADVASDRYGVASAIKLCRSVMIKGMEALAIESLLAARRHGVEDEVLASLVETFPGMQWERQADYFWRRAAQHGKRRAEEMREAAAMVGEAGIEPRMASATADVQAWFAVLRSEGVLDASADVRWQDLADRITR
jgi:3-hydroxyisobutyrate dehydrogenase-like beta-hydroxyacid dehydrogenase